MGNSSCFYQHNVGGDNGPSEPKNYEQIDSTTIISNSNNQVSMDTDGFIEVTKKKKKRKTYERTNSDKKCERSNKVKSGDASEGINRFFKSNTPQNC